MGFDPLCTSPESTLAELPLPEPVPELEPEPVEELVPELEPDPIEEPVPVLGEPVEEPVPELEPVEEPVPVLVFEEDPAPAVEPAPVAPFAVPPDPQPVIRRLAARQNVTAIPQRDTRERIPLLGSYESFRPNNERKETKRVNQRPR
jgi:hypothetical protein